MGFEVFPPTRDYTPYGATLNLYVRTDGNDSNGGRANTSAGAFLTISRACKEASRYSTYATININVADGTYAERPTISALQVESFYLTGNPTTPGNVVVKGFTVFSCYTDAYIDGFSCTNGTESTRFIAYSSSVGISHMVLGAGTFSQLAARYNSFVSVGGAITFQGSSPRGIEALMSSTFYFDPITITITGTPAYSTCFAECQNQSTIHIPSCTFSGTATGTRYVVNRNGIINTGGGGATYLPGNAAGTTATQGQYL